MSGEQKKEQWQTVISQKTLVPLGLIIVLAGAIMYVAKISSNSEQALDLAKQNQARFQDFTDDINEVKDRQTEFNLDQARTLSEIQTTLQLLTKD